MNTIATTPAEPLNVVIGIFNRAFERCLDPEATYSKHDLENMCFWAQENNAPELAIMLKRYAEIAKEVV